MANKMADKKKNTSQNSIVAPKLADKKKSASQNSTVTPKLADKKKSPSQNSIAAPKLADKKKSASQESTVAPKASSVEKEQSKSVKAVTREQKEQESKRHVNKSYSKGPAAWQVRLRSNRLIRFVLDAYYELRHKVTWPSFEEARNMTIVVLLLSGAIGAILSAEDLGLLQLFKLISGR